MDNREKLNPNQPSTALKQSVLALCESTEQNRIDSNRNVTSILRVALRADVVEGGKVHVADRLQ